MKYYLVKFEDNYADEFDICSMSVCTGDRWAHEQAVVADNRDVEINERYFGTNEFFEETTLEYLFHCYTATEISYETYAELKQMFINGYREGYGTWFKWPSTVLEEYKK